MAIRKKQIEVRALFIPVMPAFFLFFTTTDIEKTRAIISIIDKIIGTSLTASFIVTVSPLFLIYVLHYLKFHFLLSLKG